MRLPRNTFVEALPLFVFILTRFVTEDEVDTTQCGWWCPLHFAILAWALVVQDAMNGIDPDVGDTIDVRQARLEGMNLEASWTYDQDFHCAAGTNSSLKQYSCFPLPGLPLIYK